MIEVKISELTANGKTHFHYSQATDETDARMEAVKAIYGTDCGFSRESGGPNFARGRICKIDHQTKFTHLYEAVRIDWQSGEWE